MEAAFWQERWRENRIAFHEFQPNPRLVDHVDALNLTGDQHVFVPLCGKTLDLDWLLAKGRTVTGVELNEGAVREVFERQSITPDVEQVGPLKRYRFGALTVFVGDFFALTAEMTGSLDAIYDRAALVAMPETMRADYAAHLSALSGFAPQLLVTYDYDQSQMSGPPFSVPQAKIEAYYASRYAIKQLDDRPISGPLAQRCQGREQTWLLTPMTAA
ncbi:MAG: thiopurine S-methyltransferase [Pseudomonadota bacterium]